MRRKHVKMKLSRYTRWHGLNFQIVYTVFSFLFVASVISVVPIKLCRNSTNNAPANCGCIIVEIVVK